MTQATADARQQLLNVVAEAIDEIGLALEALGEAHELVDDITADNLERDLFRPVQLAYGRMQRTHSGFAERHGLAGRQFEPASAGAPSRTARDLVYVAVDAVHRADLTLSTLQDSMLPIELGDPELRAGLEDVRRLIGELPPRANQFVRTLGR